MDAVVALSEFGRERLVAGGVDPERVRVIPHGAFDYLTRQPDEVPLPDELAAVTDPVILFFGLVRPYKGVDVLLEAFRSVEGAELWVVGRPLGMSVESLQELAARAPGTVRFVPRFVSDQELPAYFRRADIVVLPHRDAEQSGVLYAALAFGKPIVMSDVGRLRRGRAHRRRLARPAGGRRCAGRAADRPARPPGGAREARRRRVRRGSGAVLLGARGLPDDGALRGARRVTILAVVFWVSVALLVYTHLGYPAAPVGARAARATAGPPRPATSRSHASRSSSPPTTRRT